MRKRLCAEDDPSAHSTRPIGCCHGVCRLHPSLAARLWLQSHSQRQRFLQHRPINTTLTFHRSTVPLKYMQTTLLKHRVGSRCEVKSTWLCFRLQPVKQPARPGPGLPCVKQRFRILFRGEHPTQWCIDTMPSRGRSFCRGWVGERPEKGFLKLQAAQLHKTCLMSYASHMLSQRLRDCVPVRHDAWYDMPWA